MKTLISKGYVSTILYVNHALIWFIVITMVELCYGYFASAGGGKVIFVSPIEGNDKNGGLNYMEPLKTIKEALKRALPGDTVVLLPGEYRENIVTFRDGTKENPITLVGMPGSIIYGDDRYGGRVITIKHSYVNIFHVNINGQFMRCEKPECYHDKLIYVEGSPEKYVEGVRIVSSNLKNALGECLRFKYVRNSEISWNKIENCGLRDFKFKLRGEEGKNGEGIYIGTSPKQDRGRADKTKNITISYNVIETNGSECIDVKENSSDVRIISNICSGNQQETTGGISIRSNSNVILRNILFNNKGAAIRLGGHNINDGIMNIVKYNFIDNYSKFSLKIMRHPQDIICENKITSADNTDIYISKKFIRDGRALEQLSARAFETCK